MADVANRTRKYVRKVVFAVHCIVLYSGFSSRGEQRSLEDRSEVTRLELQTGTAPSETTGVTETHACHQHSHGKSNHGIQVGAGRHL